MPRKKLIRTNRFTYHVTARSNNKEWFYIPLVRTWLILKGTLARASERYGSEVHNLVLMSNHFHLLISTPNANLDSVMRYWLSLFTYGIQRESHRRNHVLGARYNWSVLSNPVSLAYVYKYVARNPVRAGICARIEDYPYNSWNSLDGDLAISEGIGSHWQFIPKVREDRLTWLNKPTPKELEALITRALRRKTFQFTTDSNFQSPLRELAKTYGSDTTTPAELTPL